MADTFALNGSYQTNPSTGAPSVAASIDAPIGETLVLDAKTLSEVNLTADAPVSVDFGGVTNANVVIIKCVSDKVRVRLTSADGSQQSVPVDTFFALITSGSPITAIDLTRTPATDTLVRVFLGQQA